MSKELSVPITFNGVSIGKEKVSVGIGIDHSRVSREQMGELFVNRQLTVDLGTGEPGSRPLPGMESDAIEMSGTFEARSYSEKKDSFGTRLAIMKSMVEPDQFWDLAGRSGWLTIHGSVVLDSKNGGELPGQQTFDEESDDAEEEEAEEEESLEDHPPISTEARIIITIPEETKHKAFLLMQERQGGYYSCGWIWEGENGAGGDDGSDDGEPVVRRGRDQAMSAACGRMVDSITNDSEGMPSKAAEERRKKAIKAIKTFYSDVERGAAGAVTVFS